LGKKRLGLMDSLSKKDQLHKKLMLKETLHCARSDRKGVLGPCSLTESTLNIILVDQKLDLRLAENEGEAKLRSSDSHGESMDLGLGK
jgi:hypothetical protein